MPRRTMIKRIKGPGVEDNAMDNKHKQFTTIKKARANHCNREVITPIVLRHQAKKARRLIGLREYLRVVTSCAYLRDKKLSGDP